MLWNFWKQISLGLPQWLKLERHGFRHKERIPDFPSFDSFSHSSQLSCLSESHLKHRSSHTWTLRPSQKKWGRIDVSTELGWGGELRMTEGEKSKDRYYENTGEWKQVLFSETRLKSLEVKIGLGPPRSGTHVSGLGHYKATAWIWASDLWLGTTPVPMLPQNS